MMNNADLLPATTSERILRLTILVVAACDFLVYLSIGFATGDFSPVRNPAVPIVALVLALTWALHYRLPQIAWPILLWGLAAAFSLAPAFGIGMLAVTFAGVPFLIMLSAWTLGPRQTIALTLTTIAFLCFAAYRHEIGLTSDLVAPPLGRAATLVGLFVATLLATLKILREARRNFDQQVHLAAGMVELNRRLESTIEELNRAAAEREQAEAQVRQINTELERRVAKRTQQLEIANRDLESFSYSVSHDLRAPLRAIEGFSSMLESEYADRLDQRGRDYFDRVRGAAHRMSHLIDDLLNLSRLSRQAVHLGTVDLSALAREAADELQIAEPERKVEWIIAPDITVEGDSGLLRVVLQNLIGNAWKYSSRRELARIEFGVTSRNGNRAYFVRDNGEGFDMAYAQKLFGAFQRLHSDKEFPGNGIGLATVARIIRRMDGSVDAEGRVGEGATFYFML